jgi:arylsulfatase A
MAVWLSSDTLTAQPMLKRSFFGFFAWFAMVAAVHAGSGEPAPAAKSCSNVLVILADDLGYGDLGCYGATRINTPHIDRLAREGMRFTDAHTPSAVCSPTRYGLLTGRYCWRTWLKSNVLDGFDPPLVENGRTTLATLLRSKGYDTACIGKWHLGMTWTDTKGQPIPFRGTEAGFRSGKDVDFLRETKGGPLDCGFDSWFGISASLDMSPYAFMEGRLASPRPTEATGTNRTLFLNQGPGMRAPDFQLEGVLPALTQRAVSFLESRRGKSGPFFLYFALPSPHLPVVPNWEWQGKSKAGLYGDFVMETDAQVGLLLSALDRAGLAKNTLVLFTSDNGGLWHSWKPQEADDIAAYKPTPRGQYAAERGHFGNGKLRGTKADVYEGGHRVPFIARWPGFVKAGSVSSALLELNDVLATVAEVVGASLPPDAGEDSISFLPVLRGQAGPRAPRTFAVHHSLRGVFALRDGPWKLVLTRGSGGFSTPKTVTPQAGEATGQLYNLGTDPQETTNLWLAHPEVVRRLEAKLRAVQQGDRTRS